MKKIKKLCISNLLLLSLISASPLFATDYISAESFAEANGISHQWFPIQKMLIMRKGLNSIKFRMGESTAIANEKEIKLSGTPKIQNNKIYVPADSLKDVFAGAKSVPTVKMTPVVGNNKQVPTNPKVISQPIAITPITNKITPQNQVVTQPQIPQEQSSNAILIALRHSLRDDHTRVVLEFSNPVTYKTEFKNGIYRLNISGCKNLIPTNRSNPVGRDISKLDINSGPNREGLILTFTLNQKEKTPNIEVVNDPYRMILGIPSIATETQNIATSSLAITPPTIKTESSDDQSSINTAKPPEMEKPPEINIEVPIEVLNNKSFLGRTIVIDPGHGGSDIGFEIAGRPPEKNINLETAKLLKIELENAGFRAILLRPDDRTLNYNQRLSLANKSGSDLHISIHTGGSSDPLKHGVACYVYTDEGTYHKNQTSGPNYDNVYEEWLKNTRFDLAEFLAKKINNRLIKHLSTESRGVSRSPLQPLKFIMNPAVLVEIGMLSDNTEGKNLISDKYKEAIAKSITNAVIDFFNGIELK